MIKGADLLVSGAASIAARLGVSSLVIGLTVVSLGTSLPELLVTMVAGFRGSPDLAIGNILGSNIANVLLVLGIAAIIRPLPVHDSTVFSEIPFSFSAAVLVGFLANAALFSESPELSISRLDGAILLFFFLLFLLYAFREFSEGSQSAAGDTSLSVAKSIACVAVGVVGLYLGGDWVVDGALGIARTLGIDDALVGLTIVALGTSAPELIASAVAAYRNQTDIAVGNVVGSNIFNLLFVLGLTASFIELPFQVVNNMDLLTVIASSSLIILVLVSGRRNTISRVHGVVLVSLYLLYLAYVVIR